MDAGLADHREPRRPALDDQVLGARRPAPRLRDRRAGGGRGAARRGPSLERQRLCAGRRRLAALADREHHDTAVALLVAERDRLVAGLRGLGWITEPSTAGFFLIQVGDAAAARLALLSRGCLVRDCTSFGLSGYIRVSPRHAEQNDRLLRSILGARRRRRPACADRGCGRRRDDTSGPAAPSCSRAPPRTPARPCWPRRCAASTRVAATASRRSRHRTWRSTRSSRPTAGRWAARRCIRRARPASSRTWT